MLEDAMKVFARSGVVLALVIALYLLNPVIGVAALACGFAYVIRNRMGHATPKPDQPSE